MMVGYQTILDLATDKSLTIPSSVFSEFLTDDLVLLENPDSIVYDLNSRSGHPIDFLPILPRLGDQRIDPAALAPFLQDAKTVYVLPDRLILQSSDGKFYQLSELDLVGKTSAGDLAAQYLADHSIPHTTGPHPFYNEMPSHSDLFTVKSDGIYLLSTGQRIAENPILAGGRRFVPVGWRYDDRGVILTDYGTWLVDLSPFLPSFFQPGRFFLVRQPILLLKVPEKYWGLTP